MLSALKIKKATEQTSKRKLTGTESIWFKATHSLGSDDLNALCPQSKAIDNRHTCNARSLRAKASKLDCLVVTKENTAVPIYTFPLCCDVHNTLLGIYTQK